MRILYHATDRTNDDIVDICEEGKRKGWNDEQLNARIEQYLLEHAGGKIVGERETVH